MQSVLVVDDDPVVRGIWAFKLARAGFTVHEAADGEAGLAAAVEHHDDLVLLDWMLPNGSGIDVCRAMRGREDLSRTPVIFVSARGEECDIERAFAAGADDYLVKPISPPELVSHVQALLARNAVPADGSMARLVDAPQPAIVTGASGSCA
jgi:DNA-binding response OmpR family regulator